MIAATEYSENQCPNCPCSCPQQPGLDTLKVRSRLRRVWLALSLAGASGCVAVGLYADPPEPASHAWWWLPLFLSLAAVLVVVGVRTVGRGLAADGDGVVVRNTLRARSIPWRDLGAIEFKEEPAEQIVRHASDPVRDSEVWDISALYYKLVFQRHDGSQVTAETPAGRGIRPGEYLFELGSVCSPCGPLPAKIKKATGKTPGRRIRQSRTSRVPRQNSPRIGLGPCAIGSCSRLPTPGGRLAHRPCAILG